MQQSMNLSMTPYTQAGNFVCSQYDVGRECQITLIDDSGNYTIPTGATITVMATKPSGLGFSVECTWSGSEVTFTTTNTMTNEFGRFPAELRIEKDGLVLGTTNFYFKVEKSPHPDDVIDGDVIIQQNLVARVTTLETKMETAEDDIADLKSDIEELSGGGGLTEDVKVALLACFRHIAFLDDDEDYYGALEDALYPPADLVSISAVYSGGDVYNTATLDSLKSNLVVTAHYDDSSTETVSSYTLSGTIATGSQTITVTYGGKTTTFTITVVEWLTGITATYTQSGTVYDTDTLDDLKTDLVVTANYADSTSENVSDYTLSGTLAVGTSTITVTYAGKTATFNVSVTHESVTETVYFNDDTVTLVSDTLMKSNGSTVSLSGGSYVELPYVDGMFINSQITKGWNAYHIAVLYNGNSYQSVTLTEGEMDGTFPNYYTTLTGYSNITKVYVNVSTDRTSKSYYQVEV